VYTILSGIPRMVMAHEKPIAINYTILVNYFAINMMKTAHIQKSLLDETARIDPA
jgi:hypothetical protein